MRKMTHPIHRCGKLPALLLLFCLPAYVLAAQEAPDWYLGKPIKEFGFKGLATVAATDLKDLLKEYVGAPFTMDAYREFMNKLYALDYFETIDAEVYPGGSGENERREVRVEITVREHPSVVQIELRGNHQLNATEITEKILLKKGDLESLSKLKADEGAVRTLYLEKGFADVQVKGSFERADAENTVSAVFDIDEGPQTTIRRIEFVGNSSVSGSTLQNLMSLKSQFLFETGVFQESKLEEDRKKIVDYYTDHGYVYAKVDKVEKSYEKEDNKNWLILTVHVTEGDQWNFGGVQFEGNAIFTKEKLESLVWQKAGKVLSLQKFRADMVRIQTLYNDNGYAFNTYATEEIKDEATRTIGYRIRIVERDRAHIANILFQGNTKTKDYVLRRELPFQEGDIFNYSKIVEGYRNLVNLAFFTSVTPDAPMTSTEGLMDVVFSVEESSTANVNFGVTFSGEDFPITGSVGWEEKNFMGQGQTLGLDLVVSSLQQTLALTFTEPWLFGVRWSGGFSLSGGHTKHQDVLQDILGPVFTDDQELIAAPDPYASYDEYETAVDNSEDIADAYLMEYDSYDLDAAATTGYKFKTPAGFLGTAGRLSSSLQYIDYDRTLYRPFDITVRNGWHIWEWINKLAISVYDDNRDYYLNPTTGWYASQTLTIVGGPLFGDRHYNRTDSRLDGFVTLFDIPAFEGWNFTMVLAGHAAASFILPQIQFPAATWQDPVIDSSELLYIDGMNVGRGWKKLYGKALLDNKVELRMPVLKDILWGVLYFDAAALYTKVSDLTETSSAQDFFESMYYSFGLGLRFTIPNFPIRFYLGKKFQIVDGAVSWPSGDVSIGDFSFSIIVSLGGDVF